MTIVARKPVSLATLLRLGRVSNLPTVWTNVLAGAVLAAATGESWHFALVLVAMSLFYVGGMYLNDYFDRVIDARERPERPIPSGAISARAVAAIGFGLLGGGFVMIAAMGTAATAMVALLAAAIVAYDLHHKGNPFGPVVMGACRALVYCATAAALAGSVPTVRCPIGRRDCRLRGGDDLCGATGESRQGRQSLAAGAAGCADGGRDRRNSPRARGDRDLSVAGRLDRRVGLFARGTFQGQLGVPRGWMAHRWNIAVRCRGTRERQRDHAAVR